MFNLLLAIIYLAFISLGLPDALLGSAWPTMYRAFDVSISSAGLVSMIIAFGTIVSSLQSDRLTKKLGTGKVTAFSVLLTAVALFGFSISGSFISLCLWAIPYGLGAGSVDASINNYVAVNYASRHMSWLHCFWGVGAAIGPYIMGRVLSGGGVWNDGYRLVGIFQVGLTLVLLLSLSLWKKTPVAAEDPAASRPLSMKEILAVPGTKESMITFFCYCALEATAGLWASSYLVLAKGVQEQTAATFASLFYIGIAVGRGFSGFLTLRFNDRQMIKIGFATILLGIVALLIPAATVFALAGLILIGIGCAPVYPSIIHATPEYFGADKSQAIIGVQMAAAYTGTCLMPPLFGLLADKLHVALLPFFLVILLLLMYVMHEKLLMQVKHRLGDSL